MSSYSELHLCEAVVELRNQFRRTFDCLEVLRGKLETDLDSRFPSSVNPVRMQHRLNILKRKVDKLVSDRQSMRNRKQQVIGEVISVMNDNLKRAERLRKYSGLAVSGIPPNVTHEMHKCTQCWEPFLSSMDSTLTHKKQSMQDSDGVGMVGYERSGSDAHSERSHSSSGSCLSSSSMMRRQQQKMMIDESVQSGRDDHHSMESSVSASSSTGSSKETSPDSPSASMPITRAMFGSLSRLVRQRSTLEQLNRAYLAIYQCTVQDKENRGLPISIKKLSERTGVSLSGQSGQAIINSLRHLKLITADRKGVCIPKPYPVLKRR